jgi:hypothetical protein
MLLLLAEESLEHGPDATAVDGLPAVRLAARSVENLAVGLLDGVDEREAALGVERVGVEQPWLAAIIVVDPWLDRSVEPFRGEGAVAPGLGLEVYIHIWMVEVAFLVVHLALPSEDESDLTYRTYSMYM